MVVHAIACVTGLGENGVFFLYAYHGGGVGLAKNVHLPGITHVTLPTRSYANYSCLALGTSNTPLILRA